MIYKVKRVYYITILCHLVYSVKVLTTYMDKINRSRFSLSSSDCPLLLLWFCLQSALSPAPASVPGEEVGEPST